MGKLKCKIYGHEYWSKGLDYTNQITQHNQCHVKIFMTCKRCGTKWVVLEDWLSPHQYTNFVTENRIKRAKKGLDKENYLSTTDLFGNLDYTGVSNGKARLRKKRFAPHVRKSIQRFINR